MRNGITRGYSLLEIVIVLAIMSILTMMTIPSEKDRLQKSHVDMIKLQLLRAILLAHNEAMIRKKIVTLCHSRDQKTCSGEWSDGYIITADQEVIFSFLNPSVQGKILWRAFPVNQTQLDFLPSGASKAENGSFWYCLPSAKSPSWAIVMSQSGRAREVIPEQQGELLKKGERPYACQSLVGFN